MVAVTANDGVATTTKSVEVEITNANEPPSFSEASTTRAVPENTETDGNVGSPVTAEDPDGDTLTYTLTGMEDESSFTIDSNGQIKVGQGTTSQSNLFLMVV